MHPLLGRVPRLQALAVFESAARHGSFTAAAVELGMTQSGVSRRIKGLERAVGFPLFHRRANRVDLNDEGVVLLTAIQDGFDAIDRGLDQLCPQRSTFLLAANPGYAQRWLVPHLDSLRLALGDVPLRLRLFDRDGELSADRFDAAVHLSRPERLPDGSVLLFEEETVPVASSEYAAEHGLGADTAPERLTEVDLLDLDGRDRHWMTWTDWFAANGIDWPSSRSPVSYNNHALVIDDAIAGRGVALGWIGLVDAAIASGLLTAVGPRVARPGLGYHLIPGPGVDAGRFDALAAWLVGMAERRPAG